MAITRKLMTLVLFVSLSPTLVQSNNGGHISILVSESGLEFAKNYLINEVISTTIPLQLPNIEKKVKITLIGKVRMGLSNIQLYAVDVQSSVIDTGKDEIVLSASGATADLSMDWSYTYRASFFTISDHGDASVKVKGMDLKITATLVDDNGSLKIASRKSDCTVRDIDIHVNGGASWLYQGVVDAFEKKIISTVENTVSKKIVEKMKKLNSLLQSFPKRRKIDDSAAVNLTFTGNPVLRNSSVEVNIDGLFMPTKGAGNKVSGSHSSSHFCGVNRMVTISIEEEVFNSATLVYFNAKVMHVVIAETKNGSILSTSDWKLLPDLYRLYPEDKMMLDMTVTSPPAVQITENGIGATIPLEITINVQDSGKVLPITCLSSVLNVAGSAEIAKSSLIGSLRLINFNATVKWNKIGEFQSKYVEAATSKALGALFFPYVNTRLQRGFPLPIPSGFAIKNTRIVYVKSGVLVCSDIYTNISHYTTI